MGFSGISLQSRPAALVYGYYSDSPIVIDFESDYLPLSDEQVYGTAGAKNVTALSLSEQATALAVPVAANETAAVGTAANNTTAGNATIVTKINSSVSDTKARLAATREKLKKNTQNDTGNASPDTLKPTQTSLKTEDIM